MGSCNGMAFFPSNFMLQNLHDHQDDHHHNHPPSSLNSFLPSSSSSSPHHQSNLHVGVASTLVGNKRPNMTQFTAAGYNEAAVLGEDHQGNGEDEYSDDGSQVGEKKRRLNMEQVRTLEKNFELGNKLEPERKMHLARALGLQPRQVAIWFQNRRARWKTKQLEKDYDILKTQFEAIKADNDSLQSQNKKLHQEIMALKSRSEQGGGHEYIINLNKESDQQGSSSNRSENSTEINLDISRSTPPSIDSPSLSSPRNHNRPPPTTTTTTTLFPSPHLNRPTVVAQLLPKSSSLSSNHFQQYHQNKMEPTTVHQDDQSFTNMFCGIDEDQPNFWPWPEQQQFHE